MFYDRFIELCQLRGVSPSRAATEAGIHKSTVTKWKQKGDTKISGANLERLTAYFGLSPDELYGLKATEEDAGLTRRDERDIERRLEAMLGDLEGPTDGLMFSGEPLDEETRELLAASLRNQLEMTKRLAKQRYTPKKYRAKEGE